MILKIIYIFVFLLILSYYESNHLNTINIIYNINIYNNKKTYIYKCLYYIYLIIKNKKNEVYSKKVVLNAVAYADNGENSLYLTMADDFNKYAEEKKLDISINMNIYKSYENFTNQESFATAVDQLLKKKSNKYDLYYYDNAYTPKYGKYLLDLRNYLSKEHIDMYQQTLLEETCEYENKLVGLVKYLYIYNTI